MAKRRPKHRCHSAPESLKKARKAMRMWVYGSHMLEPVRREDLQYGGGLTAAEADAAFRFLSEIGRDPSPRRTRHPSSPST